MEVLKKNLTKNFLFEKINENCTNINIFNFFKEVNCLLKEEHYTHRSNMIFFHQLKLIIIFKLH